LGGKNGTAEPKGIREGDNGGNSASFVNQSSVEVIGPMPKVKFSREFCPASYGTLVPVSLGTFVRRAMG